MAPLESTPESGSLTKALESSGDVGAATTTSQASHEPPEALQRVVSTLPGLRLASHSKKESLIYNISAKEMQVKADLDIEDDYAAAESSRFEVAAAEAGGCRSLLCDVLNISNVLTDGASALVDDSFLRCFTSNNPDPWNWNIYLFPAWVMGVVFRYCLLFPLRLVILLANNILFFAVFFSVSYFMKDLRRKNAIERRLVQYLCACYLASWTAVVRYHGPRPTPAANRVWVANHTSMIDYVILCSYSPFSVVMQLHSGWIAFLQTRVLNSLDCLWFNRTEVTDRLTAADRMKRHVSDPNKLPLLIFPEGTCVNNEYSVMFKRGAFDLDATVCPVAIKYNKIFVDAFWNSKKQSFAKNLIKLMTSWAVVCDVYFLEPQVRQPGEASDAFASRVQKMIAEAANLRIVPWDGYLKYYNLAEKHPQLVEKRRKVVADMLRTHLTDQTGQPSKKPQDAPAEPADAGQGGAAKNKDL